MKTATTTRHTTIILRCLSARVALRIGRGMCFMSPSSHEGSRSLSLLKERFRERKERLRLLSMG